MTSDIQPNVINVPRKGDGNTLPLSKPQPGRSAELIDPKEMPNLLNKLKAADPVSSFRPPMLPVELASAQLSKPSVNAVAAANSGTAPRSLFDNWPYSTMGKVFVGRTNDYNNAVFVGSGVLVGRHTLLTASHVVPWEWVASGDWWVRFVPAYFNGAAPYGDSYVSGWYGFKTDSVEGDDYVVCDLYESLGDRCGWLGVISLKESRYDDYIYTSVGYPGDVPERGQVPYVEYGLTIQDIDDEGENAKELETRLFGGKGWSGGPLFSDIDGGTLIVGVRSGRENDFLTKRRVVHAGGRKLVDIVRYAHENWKRSEWSGWQALGGSFPAGVNPAAVSRNSGSIELFCRSHDNHIWQTFRQPDGNWSGWFQIPDPGDLIGDLAVVSMSPDNLQLFGVGTDSQMWSKWWTDAGGWSGWQALGGSFPAGVNPAAVSRSPGSIELFCRSHDNHIWQTFRQPDGSSWSGWFQIPDPGDLSGDLAVVSMSPDNLQLFGTGTDSQMWSKWWAPM